MKKGLLALALIFVITLTYISLTSKSNTEINDFLIDNEVTKDKI